MSLTAFQTTCALTIGLLLFASLCIYLLKTWKPQHELFQKVAIIIQSWWLIAGAFLLALSWYQWGTIIFMHILSLLVIREYLNVSKAPHKIFLMISLSILCTLQYLVLLLGSIELFLSLLPVLCLWIVAGLVIFGRTIKEIELVTAVGIGLSLVIYYISHIAALSWLPQLHLKPDEATFAVLILILITWCNDVFQFLAGKCFGQRKIVLEISPNKTLAGFIGGIVGTTLLATLCIPRFLNLSLIHSIFLGIVIGITGMFGDLFFSAVKRKLGIKDFSHTLPGHGGLLDRMDSLIFTAPIYFHYLLFVKG